LVLGKTLPVGIRHHKSVILVVGVVGDLLLNNGPVGALVAVPVLVGCRHPIKATVAIVVAHSHIAGVADQNGIVVLVSPTNIAGSVVRLSR
jgi:hypothetical protein